MTEERNRELFYLSQEREYYRRNRMGVYNPHAYVTQTKATPPTQTPSPRPASDKPGFWGYKKARKAFKAVLTEAGYPPIMRAGIACGGVTGRRCSCFVGGRWVNYNDLREAWDNLGLGYSKSGAFKRYLARRNTVRETQGGNYGF